MAQEHKLAIFRGLVRFPSNTAKIWGVLIFLSIVTAIEVVLGILRPPVLEENFLLGLKYLNWIFIALTLVKAYYIAWDFMHLRDETSGLRRTVVWVAFFLIAYLVFILLLEGNYIFRIFKESFLTWKF